MKSPLVGRWYIGDGLRPLRVRRVEWTPRALGSVVYVDVLKKDGSRATLKYYAPQWFAAERKRRVATPEEAAELDKNLERWGLA